MKEIKPFGGNDPYASLTLISHTEIDFTDKFTSDQMPVLAARVSHAGDDKTGKDTVADKRLMKYLAEHKHMSVFEHMSVTFKIVAPLFVVREWHRHRTQSYNEISMRYTDDPVGKFYMPSNWRQQESRNKQGSAGSIEPHNIWKAESILKNAYDASLKAYKDLLSLGVCREQARMVVPVGNYTEFYATANLRNWFNFWVLRHAEDAQWEIRMYADAIDSILSDLWPDSWSSLKNSYK